MTLGAFAGFLQGAAGSIERKRDRAERRSLLDAAERMGRPDPSLAGSGGGGADAGRVGERSPAFVYDGEISDRPAYAYNYLTENGVSPIMASGLVGNLMQESGKDIDPAASGDNGNAFGSAQWNGPRMRAYMGYAKGRGAEPTDFKTQLDFLLHEGRTTEKAAWSAIAAAKTPEEAALIASGKFWRPGVPHNERRQGYATAVYGRFGAAAPEPEIASDEPTDWLWFRNRKGAK
jgi:hypothetical protein